MGCGQSTPQESDQSRSIDKQIEKDRLAQSKLVTIFLAGTGESGKSTVLKQLRLRYAESDPYSAAEREEYRSVILSNTVQSMVAILEALPDLGLEFSSQVEAQWTDLVFNVPSLTDHLDHQTIDALAGLWQTPQVKAAVAQASQFQLNDSAPYFFDNLSRTSQPNFVPTNDDILRARVRTTGIIETKFKVRDKIYRVLDVGGQRSERRKWVSCFEGVDVLLFLFSLSEYDQTLYEDETANRFMEAETLFSSISNSLWFKSSTLIVFFNKLDLFERKLQTVQFSNFIEEYQGPNSPDAVKKYIKDRILGLYRGQNAAYSHFTCATDTNAISVVLGAVQDQIANSVIREAFLM